MVVDNREKTVFFEKYWIGVAVKTDAVNLEVGKRYLLKDRTGSQNYFEVSPVIGHNDSYFGWYLSDHFEVIEDVTEAILAMPFTRTYKYDALVSQVRMRARNRNLSFDEAQKQLISEGVMKDAVVNSVGEALIQHATLYQERKVEEFKFPKPPTKKEVKQQAEKQKPVQRGLFG